MPKVHTQVKEPATTTSTPTADTGETNKKNGSADTSAPTTDTSKPTEIIPFEDAVRECKKIRVQIEGRNEDTERDHFRIGEIADKVETKYGDRTHAKLAERSGFASSCLKRYLSVYRAYKGTSIGAPGPQSVSYSVLRELAMLDDREKIIRDNPDITKREAEQLRRERKKGTASSSAQQAQSSGKHFLKDKRGFLKDICNSQEEVRRKAEEALDTDEQLDDLDQGTGKHTLENLLADAKVVVELAKQLLERRRRLEEKDETEEAEPKNVDALVATEHAHPEVSVQVEAGDARP